MKYYKINNWDDIEKNIIKKEGKKVSKSRISLLIFGTYGKEKMIMDYKEGKNMKQVTFDKVTEFCEKEGIELDVTVIDKKINETSCEARKRYNERRKERDARNAEYLKRTRDNSRREEIIREIEFENAKTERVNAMYKKMGIDLKKTRKKTLFY